MGYVITILVAYLIGTSNLAFYLAKLQKKDITKGGSGNLGASNATLLLGWWAGIAVAAHDIAKAAIAVLLAQHFFPELPYIGSVAGVACVLGHIFPFYLRFRGGKGFASYLGMSLALNWKLALVVMVLVFLVTVITDYIVVGTLSAIVTVPVGIGILTKGVGMPLILLIATAVILYKHRENIVRIWNHKEIGLRSAIRGEHIMK